MKKKYSSTSLEDLFSTFKKNKQFVLFYEENKYYLKMARIICDLRVDAGLTQLQVAKKAKVSQPMIARIEKGDFHRVPTLATMHKILMALGYTISLEIKPYKSA